MIGHRFGRRTVVWMGVFVVVGVLLLGGLASSGGRPESLARAAASPLSVSVTVSPQTVSESSMFTVTAVVSGGPGPFSYSWNTYPVQCPSPGNVSSWTCALDSSGQFTVGVSVTNAEGASGSGSQSFTVTSSGGNGNGNGNGNGGSSSNGNGSNGLNLSSFGPILVYGLIAGIVVFALLIALTVGVIMIAVTLSRRLPRIPRHGVVCASCHATAPGGSKFCPACAAPLPPPT
ncbi:MAG: hypothetical protein ACLPP2_07455 [Thermoplasmata archaeon]